MRKIIFGFCFYLFLACVCCSCWLVFSEHNTFYNFGISAIITVCFIGMACADFKNLIDLIKRLKNER